MPITTMLFVDPNTFRGSAFAALLAPWALQSGVEFRVVQNAGDEADLAGLAVAACLINVGGLSLSDPDVIQTTEGLRDLFTGVPLIVFSDNTDPFEVDIALDNKLQGFILTTMPAHVALAAVQFIMNGGTYHPRAAPLSKPVAVRNLGTQRYPAPEGWLPSLRQDSKEGQTNFIPLKKVRHVEVLRYLIQGETNKEIARRLKLTEATVKVYVRELMLHYGAKNRMQVVLNSLAAEPTDPPYQPGQSFDAEPCHLYQ